MQTAGDVTNAIAVLTTRPTQGGSASPALFRVFIDDLVSEIRSLQGKHVIVDGESLRDPFKFVADDVIVITKIDEELQKLLEVYTDWSERNQLEWKPQKCSAVETNVDGRISIKFFLAAQTIPRKEEV